MNWKVWKTRFPIPFQVLNSRMDICTLTNIIKHFVLVSNVLLVCECLQEKKIRIEDIQRDEEGRDRKVPIVPMRRRKCPPSSITHVKLEGRGTQKIERLAHATEIRMGPRFAMRGQHPRARKRD